MQPDSPLVTRTHPSLGHRRGKYGPRREYNGIAVHVTGSGPLTRYRDGWRPEWAGLDADSTLLDVACAIYGGMMNASPAYLVFGQDIVQLVPEDEAAWHVGSPGWAQYQSPDWARHARYDGRPVDVRWWGERWPYLGSPVDLCGGKAWSGGSANDSLIGIEVLWPSTEQRLTPSPDTYETLGRLLRDVCERRGIPADPRYVVGHSDIHPAARSANGEAWDPPPDILDPVRIARLLRVPAWCGPR